MRRSVALRMLMGEIVAFVAGYGTSAIPLGVLRVLPSPVAVVPVVPRPESYTVRFSHAC